MKSYYIKEMESAYNAIFRIAGESLEGDKRLEKLTYETYLGLDKDDERRIAVDNYIKEALDKPITYKKVYEEVKRIKAFLGPKEKNTIDNFDSFIKFGDKLFGKTEEKTEEEKKEPEKEEEEKSPKTAKETLAKLGIGKEVVKEEADAKKEEKDKGTKKGFKDIITTPFKALGRFNKKNQKSVLYNLGKTAAFASIAVVGGVIIATGGFPGLALANALTTVAMGTGVVLGAFSAVNTISLAWDKFKNRKMKEESKEEKKPEKEEVEEKKTEKEEEKVEEKEPEKVEEKETDKVVEKTEEKVPEKIEEPVKEEKDEKVTETDETTKSGETLPSGTFTSPSEAKEEETAVLKSSKIMTPEQLMDTLDKLSKKEEEISLNISEINDRIAKFKSSNPSLSEEVLMNNINYRNLLNSLQREKKEKEDVKLGMKALRSLASKESTHYFKTNATKEEFQSEIPVKTNTGEAKTIYIEQPRRVRETIEYPEENFGRRR